MLLFRCSWCTSINVQWLVGCFIDVPCQQCVNCCCTLSSFTFCMTHGVDSLPCCAGSKSQSTECTAYVFTYTTVDNSEVTIHVTDTPGLSDTEGRLIKQILTCFLAD